MTVLSSAPDTRSEAHLADRATQLAAVAAPAKAVADAPGPGRAPLQGATS